MSQSVEKKYRVASFDDILRKIGQLGATPTLDIRTTHYYAQLDTDDTLKMVDYGDKIEIHSLSTTNGLHSLDEVIPVESVDTGLHWFKQHGYDTLEVLDMHDREFEYKDGGLALYTVNDAINSVILGYPEGSLDAMEKAFGLEAAEQINEPYNKYAASQGAVRTISTK